MGHSDSGKKPGRNDPCPCGSGKKFKKCHLQSIQEVGTRLSLIENLEADDRGRVTETIRNFFKDFSPRDVANALWTSSLWLPNIGANVKHAFLTSVFLSIPAGEFRSLKELSDFESFSKFIEYLISNTPSFMPVEDYVPETDWGEVRLSVGDQCLRFFYGSDLENPYDRLEAFRVIYRSLDGTIKKATGRSPLEDLEAVIAAQDLLIQKVPPHVDRATLSISPGDFSIPSESFWRDCLRFADSEEWMRAISNQPLNAYVVPLGSVTTDRIHPSKIANQLINGDLLCAIAIEIDGRPVPLLPRRFYCVVIDRWASELRNESLKELRATADFKNAAIGPFFGFLEPRVRENSFFRFASALSSDGNGHELVFPVVIRSGHSLILFLVAPPLVFTADLEAYLDGIAPQIQEAKRLLNESPTRLGLRGDQKTVEFRADEGRRLKPTIKVVVPMTGTAPLRFRLPRDFDADIWYLDTTLGLLDEVEEGDELTEFLSWMDKNSTVIEGPFYTVLDLFAAFKDFHGNIISGANEVNFISIDPHGGSDYRFRRLSEFWKRFPGAAPFGDPRHWEISIEGPRATRFISRRWVVSDMHCQIGPCHLFFSSPFPELTFPQAKLGAFLAECASDAFSRVFAGTLTHAVFKTYENIRIMFFPASLLDKESFKHLLHLKPEETLMRSDHGFPELGRPTLRVVVNEEEMVRLFSDCIDRSAEVQLVKGLFEELNRLIPDASFSTTYGHLDQFASGLPRFSFFASERQASFPEAWPVVVPQAKHFKAARKKIATLAKSLGIEEGSYALDQGKEKLRSLQSAMSRDLDTILSRFNWIRAVEVLIKGVDSLTNEYERQKLTLEQSSRREMDIDPNKKMAEVEEKHLQMHKNFRYLIEKIVQLRPEGADEFSDEEMAFAIAYVDWLHVIYTGNDGLYYGIHPVGLKINQEFLPEVQYPEESKTNHEQFALEQAKRIISPNTEDRLERITSPDDWVNSLDVAWKADFGFGFKNLIAVLETLTFWPQFNQSEQGASYHAGESDIGQALLRAKPDADVSQVPAILDFLTLKNDGILRLLDKENDEAEIPIWEHKKRPHRYTIRPLIQTGTEFMWGPFSTRRAAKVWAGVPATGYLPVDYEAQNVAAFLEKHREDIENALEEKCKSVTSRHTQYAEKNVFLHKRDAQAGHPDNLGDFDVIAYLPSVDTLVSIEAKKLARPHCLKDAARLRRDIFGVPDRKSGHIQKILRREEYLRKNGLKVMNTLGWPSATGKQPRVSSIYVSDEVSWWTRFPPDGIHVDFCSVSELDGQLKQLYKLKPSDPSPG